MPTIFQRLQHSWNAFRGRDRPYQYDFGNGTYQRPDRVHLFISNERSLITAIYNRISMDVASYKIEHVKVDQNGRYVETVKDGLNNCLTLEANIDQTSRAFKQDAALSMFDEGCIALVPVDTTLDPSKSSSYDINTMRVGKITQWYPQHVQVELYNENRGIKEHVIVPKRTTAIVENPFYAVMNEPNSTLQRLIRKLSLLDSIDEQSGSGKLDLIIQLPYVIKSQARREQAEQRRKDIELQLSGSKYGIAYTDGTERITQLNRPVENNLMKQIEYLMDVLYSQLGITPEILNGTADEKTMLNYNNRTIEPILAAFADEMKRKFLTKTARSQGHSIMYTNEPFRLVPINNIAEIADKFTRNEILSPNEIRSIIGMKPVADAQADELRNRNLNQSADNQTPAPVATDEINQNGSETSTTESPQQNSQDNVADMSMSRFNEMLSGAADTG